MTSQNTSPEPGYRGALPSREDRLARPWIFTILGIFALVIVLSILGVPSRFVPDETPVPLNSLPPISASPSPSASESASPSESPSASPSGSASVSPSASAAP